MRLVNCINEVDKMAKYLCSSVDYSVFEKEIRNPGKNLKYVVNRIREDKINFEDAKALIDKSIQEDIGWTRQDILEYFEIYSDMYKDCYGTRPVGYKDDYYFTIYNDLVEDNKTSTHYSDYTSLKRDYDDFYDYNLEENEEDMYTYYKQEDDEEDDANDIYDALPKQQSHRKAKLLQNWIAHFSKKK